MTKSKLALHPKYPAILQQYNEEFQRTEGKVNDLKFYREVVAPVAPSFSMGSWYFFLKRFKTMAGVLAPAGGAISSSEKQGESELLKTMLSNDQATQRGIKTALNLGSVFFEKLWEKYNEAPASLNDFEKRILSDALFKAMKAQDSRIHAIGKVREDSREQAKFDVAFDNAAFD